MRENKTKTKLRNGHPVYGVISKSGDSLIAELVALAGFDYYMVDAEHGLINPEQMVHVVRACEAADITPMVRLGQNDPKLMLAHLDAGMMGLMVPGLDSVTAVQQFVAACKYPPLGKRGLGLVRAANYMVGIDPADYVHYANDQIMLLPQFEDAALLPYFAEMMAVDGVDGCIIGPRDLSLAMGFADGPNHVEVTAVIDQAITIMNDADVWPGITAGTAAAAQTQLNCGAKIILNSLPALIRQSSEAFLSVRN
ncbi:MAG: aldolase/citrate lyase family protein [Chloroflexota bacterium]